MKTKLIALLSIIVICIVSLSGCYSAEGLEILAYVVAVGIDKGESDEIRLSLQIAKLSGDSGKSGGSSSQSQESAITTVDCASIDSGIALVNSYISKKINLSHCKAIIISEELAYEGISEYISTLVNNLEVRPNCNIIISRCKASDYLNNSKPTLESISARYYEFTLNSSEYTGYTENVALDDFNSDMLSTTTHAHAILGGVNDDKTHRSHSNMEPYDIEGSYKADETPIEAETGVENMGIAVFNGDKLVGELTGIESLCHLLVVNKLESARITVPNPYDIDSVLNIYITYDKRPKNSVKLVNGTPYIECDVSLSANILSLDTNLDFSDANTLNIIEEYTNSYLEKCLSAYLYKTAKEYKSDISNFGKHIIKNYSTWDDWIESDWLYNYQNSFFTVNVDTTIENGQLYTKM